MEEGIDAHRPKSSTLARVLDAAPLWRVALVVVLCVVTYLALAPSSRPQQDGLGWDKLNHLLAFAVLAAVAVMGFARARLRVMAALLAYGALIEFLQSLTPNRLASWEDWLADVLGVAVGALVARGVRRAASGPARLE